MNFLIFGALILQGMISRTNAKAGAIAGFLITTGILIWGLSVYASGDGIAFFFIPLSRGVFIGACVAWYGFDTIELFRALSGERGDKDADYGRTEPESQASLSEESRPESAGVIPLPASYPPYTLIEEGTRRRSPWPWAVAAGIVGVALLETGPESPG